MLPEVQVVEALAVVENAARIRECADLKRLEAALEELRKPLVSLAAAGVLASLALTVREGEDTVGLKASFALAEVEECAAVDLSVLRLVASPAAWGAIEITCLDVPLAQQVVETVLLPHLSDDGLECCRVVWQGSDADETILEELEGFGGGEEETDDYDDD